MSMRRGRSGWGSTKTWRLVVSASGVVCAVALAAMGLVMLATSAAAAAAPPAVPAGADSLLLRSDPPGTVHILSPGRPALWNVGVTVRRTPVNTLVGVVTARGKITSTGATVPVDIELLGCVTPWNGPRCGSGARTILPTTASDALPTTPAALTDPGQIIPANVWVQVRATMAPDAPPTSTGTLTVRLDVEASGAGEGPAPGTPGDLAYTGSPSLGAALLAVAAIGGGIALVCLARARRRDG